MRKMRGITPLTLSVVILCSCQRQPTREIAKLDSPAAPRVVVVGIDETGSYALTPLALERAAEFFKQNACPGDLWIFRRITRDSYSDTATIPVYKGQPFVKLPKVRPKPGNAFNKRGRLAYLRDLKRFEQMRQQVAEAVSKFKPRQGVIGTDIWGFLRKANDLGCSDIVMFTDLGDTRNLRVELNLNGARVWVLGFQSGRDPRKTVATRKRWETRLQKAGASKVTFHDISAPLPSLK
jgi:hypothetical protein